MAVVLGAILTGGASRRFGSDKALAMGPHVVESLREAGVDPVVAVGGSAAAAMGVPLLADRYPGEGPLGGVATALTYARHGHVLVVPCDLPRLDPDTIGALVARTIEVPEDTAVIASSADDEGEATVHHAIGCWPASWAAPLHRAIRAGERKYRHLLDLGPWALAEVDAGAIADADDRATLQRLRGISSPDHS